MLGLIPNGKGAPVRNDAALFKLVRRNGDEAEDLRVRHRLLELTLLAVRPSDYPDVLPELAKWNGRPETNWLVAKSMVDRAIDSGDLKIAEWEPARAGAG